MHQTTIRSRSLLCPTSIINTKAYLHGNRIELHKPERLIVFGVIRMIESILWSVGISIALIVFVGIPYIKGVSQQSYYCPTNMQEYTLANLDQFGVKDSGKSLKRKDIYLVAQERMGL
jgi:hypothetical protein